MKRLLLTGWAIVSCLLCVSCKEDDTEKPEGKTVYDLDVSAYDRWVYFSFETGVPQSLGLKEAAPAKWDIALHRGDVKTNGGSALKTDVTKLSELTQVPSGKFVSDTLTFDVVVVEADLMQEIMTYDTTEVNLELGSWVRRSGMPPVYTVAPQVYVVRTKDGKHAKIRFSSYKSAMDKAGHATFSYEYPFE